MKSKRKRRKIKTRGRRGGRRKIARRMKRRQ
jgi:hypothetical protein